MDTQEEVRQEYLETLKRNGEIEFSYNGFFYHIEPDYDKKGMYNIWRFTDEYEGGGEKIAVCSSAESVLEEKVFEDKKLLEIIDDMTDCILR